MKMLVLASVGLVALGMAAPASAADMAVKAPPPPIVAPIYNWSGFYIGANGGGAWSSQCINITAVSGVAAAEAEGCRDASGGVVGGQIGYRWQTPSSWVFGLEAQGDWANIRTSRTSLFFPLDTWRSTVDGLGLFTGQIGYAWNASLFYVKGGAAVANQRWDLFNNATGVGLASAERTRWGGTVGVGWEYGFAPNWSAGIEYDHIFSESDNRTFVTPGLAPITSLTVNTRSDIDMVTARINYHFNWGNPVVARY
ncbi:outer membrane beta-barrel protein [Bradyrhizobium sp. NP1]|uniref:outer membrane protein n=1 Tax=Bradyrhizobium sp. NP1 TaxID=3049772 RepID=UPI0025A5A11D|nr:outer membrane beta-barrel protein [Bradyrhizobium sp. NP1]WJR79186.1 outer membrane beta-barrel protein [Bradyrhizobium sp. NP1]